MNASIVHVSPGELVDRAREVDEAHRDSMRSFRDETALEVFGLSAGRGTRRDLFRAAGLASAVLTLGTQLVPVRRLMPTVFAQQELTDVDVGVFAESVELAAVAAYEAAVETARLSDAAIEVATLFAGHHRDHAGAFAALVGEAATGAPNGAVLDVFAPRIEAAVDEVGLLEIARQIEEGAAATYHFALGLVQDPAVAAAPATILPIESAHAVVLGQAIGTERAVYLPSLQSSDGALDPADFPVGSGGAAGGNAGADDEVEGDG